MPVSHFGGVGELPHQDGRGGILGFVEGCGVGGWVVVFFGGGEGVWT